LVKKTTEASKTNTRPP